MNGKLIVNFAPTGMVPTKAMTPHVPIGISEIVEDVHRAWEIGITMVHLHARDQASGEPTWEPDIYARTIEDIRSFAPGLIIGVSLSGRTFGEFEKRSAACDLDGALKPDMGSLTLSSLNFNRQASVNEPRMIQGLAQKMKDRGIVPELEAFDLGMVNTARYLIRKELLEPPFYFNLLLGNIAGAQPDLVHVGTMIKDLPEGSLWALAGMGPSQLPMNSLAIAMGGGVRVGIEDNIHYDAQREKLATNKELVERVHALAGANGRTLMTAAELRGRLNLLPGHGRYGRARSGAADGRQEEAPA